MKESANDHPMVSIIVVNFNGNMVLIPCVESLLGTSYPNFEVVVVDNGSTDGSITRLRRTVLDPRVQIRELGKNLGPASARNLGCRESDGPYVGFVHSDVQVEPHWLAPLVNVLEQSQLLAAVQAKSMLYDYRNRFDSMGVIMDKHGCSTSLGKSSALHLEEPSAATHLSDFEVDHGQFDKLSDIFATTFVATVMNRRVFDLVGGFDPDFFGSLEDVDISWRIRLAGYAIAVSPNAIVYHRGGSVAKTRRYSDLSAQRFSKNRLSMLLKNYSFGSFLRNLPAIIGLYVMFLSYTLLLDRRLFLPYFKGIMHAILDIKKLYRKRILVQRLRAIPDEKIFRSASKRCITLDYKLSPWLNR